jgi:hypothetical protein
MAHYTNAAALIVAAAKKSGLLREVAEAIYCFDQHQIPTPSCSDGSEVLCDVLADLFDDYFTTPGSVLKAYFGNGFEPGPYSDAVLAPYLNVAPHLKVVEQAK